MTSAELTRRARLKTWLAQRNRNGDFLLLATSAMTATMVLSNNYNLAPRLFWIAFLPAALIWQGHGSFAVAWPRMHITTTLVFRLAFSVTIAAALLYVVGLNIATMHQTGLDRRAIDSQWILAGEILFFISVTAHAAALIDRFLPRLIAALTTIVATSAAINIFYFVRALSTSMFDERLVNWLGMPGYTNSTNISLTYAVFFAGALAIIISSRQPAWLRLWLTPFAALLLIGVMLTQSRSAYLATAFSSSVLLVFQADRGFWRRHWLKLLAAALVVGMSVAAVPRVRQTMTSRGESYRPEIWRIFATQAIKQPFRGTGGLANIDITLSDGYVVDQPHNLILSAQVRGGLFCALAMIVLLFASLIAAVRFQIRRHSGVALGMILAVIVAGLFDYNLLITFATWPWLTFWLPFAVCAGAEIALRDRNRSGDDMADDAVFE